MLTFEDNADRIGHTGYYLPKKKLKAATLMLMVGTLLTNQYKNDIRTYENNRKIVTGQIDDYTTSYLLDYPYLKEN